MEIEVAIDCPICQTKGMTFRRARLLLPLQNMGKKLENASDLGQDRWEQPMTIKHYTEGSQRNSANSRSLQSSSGHSFLNFHHSRPNSGDNTSQSGSSRGKRSSSSKSGSSTSKMDFFSKVFTDGNFVLAFTSDHICCYDCEMETWSNGCFFKKIIMAAGSGIRYAVISREANVSFRSSNISRIACI